jgi:hypothetical protein
MVGCKGDYN